MNALSCDEVRELLPEQPAGRQLPAVGAHLAACAECRAQADLLARLRAAAPAPPPNLEARVLRKLRTAPSRPQWWGNSPLARAATVALVLLGGGLLVRSLERARPSQQPVAPGAPAALPVLLDPAVYGGSVLSNLTDAELQALLAGMES